MNRATRDRLVLPILIPVGALALIALLVLGFSRILLSLSKDAATVTAIIVAVGIVSTAAVLSSLPKIRVSNLVAGLGAVAGLAMLAGGIALATVGGKTTEQGPSGPLPAILAITAPVGAASKGFAETKLTTSAGNVQIKFSNQDVGITHNVDVFSSKTYAPSSSIGKTNIITGPASTTVTLTGLKTGTLYFHCDVHPTQMTGTIVVKPAGVGGGTQPTSTPSAGGTTAAPAGAVPLTAPAGAATSGFQQSSLTLPATGQVTVQFQNEDAGQMHNLGIYSANPATDPSASELFKGDPVTGPGSTVYSFAALPQGTYYFQCDFHPTTMHGTVKVG